ncbi:hypothetical protein LOTGIDRAFT_128887 [Lottia gigantea]|uniref:Amino acid permease/ SLC12A domain-containing protein n=1 Tax=Lottia gigantea TaxID=225164 RepID=V4BDF2_LOTGI|nr:hypothetical protein LOTGIDRAFT_128887 [Lottia gigantea]ESO86494.1 hypothetical protein LOTGIDRAFT_128887 [Lottia gigantea]
MIEENEEVKRVNLKSHLSTTSLVVLGVSSTIGSGIYIVIGVVAKEHAGAYVILCFVLAGIIAFSNSLAYSELSCRYKGCGGIFTFMFKSWGVTQGFLVGWLSLHGTSLGVVFYSAQTFSSYINQILDQTKWIVTSNVTNTSNSGSFALLSSTNSYSFNVPATALIVLSSCILISGTTNLFNVTKFTTVISTLALLIFIICGLQYGDVHNIVSFQSHSAMPIHISGILRGAAICYFAYTGFSAVCSSGEEAKDAKRSIPIAIIVVMIFVGLLYCGVTVSVLMLQPYRLFDTKAPLMAAVQYAHISRMRYVILVGMTVGLIQVNLSCLYQVSRLVFSMARDRLLPSVFAAVSGSNKTPMLAIIVSGLYSVVACSVISFKTLISFSTICIFVNSTLANILIVWINCYTELIETTFLFQMIMVPYLPVFNMFINIHMLVSMSDSIGFLYFIFLTLLGKLFIISKNGFPFLRKRIRAIHFFFEF